MALSRVQWKSCREHVFYIGLSGIKKELKLTPDDGNDDFIDDNDDDLKWN